MAECPVCSKLEGTLVSLPLLPPSRKDRARKRKCRGREQAAGPEAREVQSTG